MTVCSSIYIHIHSLLPWKKHTSDCSILVKGALYSSILKDWTLELNRIQIQPDPPEENVTVYMYTAYSHCITTWRLHVGLLPTYIMFTHLTILSTISVAWHKWLKYCMYGNSNHIIIKGKMIYHETYSNYNSIDCTYACIKQFKRLKQVWLCKYWVSLIHCGNILQLYNSWSSIWNMNLLCLQSFRFLSLHQHLASFLIQPLSGLWALQMVQNDTELPWAKICFQSSVETDYNDYNSHLQTLTRINRTVQRNK